MTAALCLVRDAPAPISPLIAAAWRGCLAAACAALGLDVADVARLDPARQRRGCLGTPIDRRGALARRLAYYLLNTELGVPQILVARVAGVTPAAVCLALRDIEDLREARHLDRLIEHAAAWLRGE